MILDRVESTLPDIYRSMKEILDNPRMRLPVDVRVAMKGIVKALEKPEFYISYIPLVPVIIEEDLITKIIFAFTVTTSEKVGPGPHGVWRNFTYTVFNPVAETLTLKALRLITAHELTHATIDLGLATFTPPLTKDEEEKLARDLEELLIEYQPNLYEKADIDKILAWVATLPDEKLRDYEKLKDEIVSIITYYVKPNARVPKPAITHAIPPPTPPPPPIWPWRHLKPPPPPPPPPPRPPRRR